MRTILGAVLACWGLVGLVGCDKTTRITQPNLDRVRPGMTLAQVEEILGPGQVADKEAPKPVFEEKKDPAGLPNLDRSLWNMLKWRKWSDGSRTYLVGFIDEGDGKLTVSVTPFALNGSEEADDDSRVELRGPAAKVGQVIREKSHSRMKDADFIIKAKEGTVRAKTSMSGEQEIEKKVLAMDGGAVTKFQRRFIKDEKTIRIRKPGQAEEVNEEIGELAGQVVITEKVKGKWKHTLKDGEPTQKQRIGLLELTGWEDDDSTPEGKQPVGTTWEIDATHLSKIIGPGITGLSGKAKATFARIEKYQGDRCAVIEVTGHVKGKMVIEGKEATTDNEVQIRNYLPINRRGYTKTITDSTSRVVIKIDDQTTVETSGKLTAEEETEVKD